MLVILVGAAAAVAIALKSSKATLGTDPVALAKVTLPLGGGTIESVRVYGGKTDSAIPVHLTGKQIWPDGKIPAHTTLSVQVVVKRPSAVAWLTGQTEHLNLTLITPSAHLKAHFLTVGAGQPLRLQFAENVSTVSSGSSPTNLHPQTLATPASYVTLARTAEAGTIYVAAAPRTWESSTAALISWFPAGSSTTAIANPQPGSTINANTPITLTFNKPVSKALGGSMPPVLPQSSGTWHQLSSHSIEFQPSGFGYGLGAHVTLGLPNGVRLVGAQQSGDAWGSWTVPAGNPLRLQQLLAVLGYLPLRFRYDGTGPGPSTANQLEAAIKPPAGHFTWRYPNTPSALVNMWAPGTFGEMTKGAIMAFENSNGMTADGIPGPQVWNALITAAVQGKANTFGYTFVQVSEGSPESQSTWHNGHTVVSGPVNTGIPQAPTAQGVFAVFAHAPSVTMSGTNPDGSHYSDPGVPYVSYFNGGDALHGFERGSYGSPQSLGCVEMPYSEA
ncbi:MAG: murein L,D-transpeptidase, partial [Solirubrobacterales bacterium]|nr:murein L,D-transpeptidase [Solirubrobacterales bacterium]